MAVKQVFETYVYDPGLSSVGQMPFVLTRVSARHGKACGGMPHDLRKSRMSPNDCGSWLACDADARVYQAVRVDAIAGKPSPTEERACD